MESPIIYSTDKINFQSTENSDFVFKFWQPTLKNMYPPRKSRKYIVYYLFHILGVFRNKNYSAVLVYEKEILIASLLIVPKHFKWPFMRKKDVQFIYVLTKAEYRGKGLAVQMISFGYDRIKDKVDSYWYVTTEDNSISQKVADKCGFIKIGIGIRKRFCLDLGTNINVQN